MGLFRGYGFEWLVASWRLVNFSVVVCVGSFVVFNVCVDFKGVLFSVFTVVRFVVGFFVLFSFGVLCFWWGLRFRCLFVDFSVS